MSVLPGLRAELVREVTDRDTAHAFGNEGVHVLGTPALVGWLEDVALAAIAPQLVAGTHSVGTSVEMEHLAPTPVGLTVTLSAEVLEVDGRRVRFAVAAHDDRDEIARGTHTRFVVDTARFDARVDAKRPG